MSSPNTKRVVVYRTNDGELANQLWNYISIYAYCLEKGYELENYAFYEYGEYFNLPVKNALFRYGFFAPFGSDVDRKWSFKKRLWRKLHFVLTSIIIRLRNPRVLAVENSKREAFYLPPSGPTSSKLKQLEETSGEIILSGWLFRNPEGIEKYRKEIHDHFQPKERVLKTVSDLLSPIRTYYKHLIGVHIRQGDYRQWLGGKYLLSQERVRAVLGEFLKENNLSSTETCFIIASDGKIDAGAFAGLNTVVSKNGPVEDLFMLSQTEAIIGSNSTFGDFAAYYGNIPHIIATNEPMDWEYYLGKKHFFPNKYCTWVHY